MLSDQAYDVSIRQTEARMTRKERLDATGIPVRFWDKSWDDYEPRQPTRQMRNALMEYVVKFVNGEPRMNDGRGFLLQGPPGVGKTMAACLAGLQLSDSGFCVRYTTLAGYVNTLVRQITLQKAWEKYEDYDALSEWKGNDERLRRIREVAHLVILDDVGKEHLTGTGWAVNTFDVFLRERLDRGRPVAMTTNVPVKEWAKRYSPAMASFVWEACDIYAIADDEDMRR